MSNGQHDEYKRQQRSSISLLLLSMLCVLILASCATRKMDVKPSTGLPETFSLQGEFPLPEKWWTAFEDERLNNLIEEALTDNFSLMAAWDRLNQARALATRAGADLLPSLDGSGSASRKRSVSETVIGTSPDGASSAAGSEAGTKKDTSYSNSFSLGLIANYEIDLWGRIRSSREAALLDVAASKEDVHAAAMTLSADIARIWFRLIEQNGQMRLLDEQNNTNQKQLEIITLKFRRGQASATDVLQQRQLVESNRGERILAQTSIDVLANTLDVLTGKAPGTFDMDEPETLPVVASLPETGLLADWLRRRPDVRAAEYRVMAADKRVGEAIANMFPQFSISVKADTSSSEAGDLFINWASTLAANVVAPLFEGGARRAEVRRSRAVVSERLHTYTQVVLTSLREVEDALAQETGQALYLESLYKQIEFARISTEQVLDNYTKATMDFTRYLTTLLSYQNLQRKVLEAERNRVLYRIDLYKSLSGSWWLENPVVEHDSQIRNITEQFSGGGTEFYRDCFRHKGEVTHVYEHAIFITKSLQRV